MQQTSNKKQYNVRTKDIYIYIYKTHVHIYILHSHVAINKNNLNCDLIIFVSSITKHSKSEQF